MLGVGAGPGDHGGQDALRYSKGVSGGNWRACANDNGTTRYLGTFPTEEEAARAYDAWAFRKWGEIAHLNFPTEFSAEE